MSLFEPQSLAEGLRLLIQRAGLTVEETARRANLGVSTLHNYLRVGPEGRTPDAHALRRLAHVLSENIDSGTSDEDVWTVFGRLLDLPISTAGSTVSTRARMRRKASEHS